MIVDIRTTPTHTHEGLVGARQERFYTFTCGVTPSGDCENVFVQASAPVEDALRYEATITDPEGTQQGRGYTEFAFGFRGLRCGGEWQFTEGGMDSSSPGRLPERPRDGRALPRDRRDSGQFRIPGDRDLMDESGSRSTARSCASAWRAHRERRLHDRAEVASAGSSTLPGSSQATTPSAPTPT